MDQFQPTASAYMPVRQPYRPYRPQYRHMGAIKAVYPSGYGAVAAETRSLHGAA